MDGGAAVVQNFSYDANGAEAGTSNASGTSANGWNFEGKLTQTALSDANGNAAGGSANVFDAQEDRLSHTDDLGKTSQKTTSYLVDTDTSYSQVIEERAPDVSDAAGQPALQARYVAPLAMWRKLPDGSVKLFFHLSDGQESVRQLTDTSGAVVDSYFYDAWGNTLDGSSHNVVNPFRYTGQQLDADGKYYLRARFYNPGTGRFLSHDPLMGSDSDPVSMHRYLYAGGDGINSCDPSGRMSLGETMVVGAVIGALGGALHSYAVYGTVRVQDVLLGAGIGAAAAFAGAGFGFLAATGTASGGIVGGLGLGVMGAFGGWGLASTWADDYEIATDPTIPRSQRAVAVADAGFNAFLAFWGARAGRETHAVARQKMASVVADAARFQRSTPGYGAVDPHVATVLQPGDIIAQTWHANKTDIGSWFTIPDSAAKANYSAADLAEGLQVQNQRMGTASYPAAQELRLFRVTKTTIVASSHTTNNTQNGAGGFAQHYLDPADVGSLEPAGKIDLNP